MPTPRTTRATSASILATATALAALSSCTSIPIAGTPTPAPPTTTPITTTPTASTTVAQPSLARDRAAAVANAKAWLTAYRGDQWTDSPTSWIDRVRPLVTTRMHTANLQVRDAAANHDWHTFVTSRCTSNVTDLDVVIPPEAPITPTTLNIQVAGTVRTHCATNSLATSEEPATATILMTLTPRGWLVDQRLY